MRDPTVYAYDDSEWQVPEHEVAVYCPRRHAHALVIPVINEGERIRAQLLRIKAAHLPVDVIIADGGSTDGSLEADFVREAGVATVLTKTGPGKLSAQLRMAYAWCIRQGYRGIVTIDGNGKDGVEAVATIVAKLEAGCNYVQGSRYLPGGEAENTPLERTIANRLIHAPLLSLAGRHVFTDTTNGFRGYSARYLTHPQVQPFRDVFDVYSLLFYLTVRAGQLGLEVDHCPVVRRYPQTGKVPTKIGGLSSKLALLGETVTAATGGYTPDEAPRRISLWSWPLIIALLVALPLLLGALISPPYSPDSWAFYELGQTLFTDFYRASHIRSYAADIPYSAAFPPLWPALIGYTDALLGTGARTGLYLAFASFIGFALASEAIGRRVTGANWIGLAIALALVLGPKMIGTELAAGRTIPVQLALYALIVLGLLRGEAITITVATAIGVAAGLAILNRFDALPLPLFVAAMVWWLTRRPVTMLAVLGAAAATASPWIAYSLTTFGTLFATDNAGIATSLDPQGFVTDWWPSPRPGMAEDPTAWLDKVIGQLPGFAYLGAAVLASPLGLAFAMALAAWGALHLLASRRPNPQSAVSPAPPGLGVLACFAAITAALMAPQIVTGYSEYRYFSALAWAGFLTLTVWAITRGVSVAQRRFYAHLIAFVLAMWIAAFTGLQAVRVAEEERLDFARWPQFEAPFDVEELARCLGPDAKARVLVMGDDLFAARAGALAGLTTMMEPRNMAKGRLGAGDSRVFLDTQRVEYVLALDEARRRFAQATFTLTRAPGCALPLYRVER